MLWAILPRRFNLIASYTVKRHQSNAIQTLHPKLLKHTDYIDVSRLAVARIGCPVSGVENRDWFRMSWEGYKKHFPPGSHGFLYFYYDRRYPTLKSEIRFRVTPDSDPTHFDSGKDLLLPKGNNTWAIPLPKALLPRNAGLKYLILKDGLLDHDTMSSAEEVWKEKSFGRRSSFEIHSMKDTFALDLSKETFKIRVITSQGKKRIWWPSHFHGFTMRPRSSGSARGPAFNGRFLAKFERSSLSEHAGKDVVVVRIVKVLEPIKLLRLDYADIQIPGTTAGSLLQKNGGELVTFDLSVWRQHWEGLYHLMKLDPKKIRSKTSGPSSLAN